MPQLRLCKLPAVLISLIWLAMYCWAVEVAAHTSTWRARIAPFMSTAENPYVEIADTDRVPDNANIYWAIVGADKWADIEYPAPQTETIRWVVRQTYIFSGINATANSGTDLKNMRTFFQENRNTITNQSLPVRVSWESARQLSTENIVGIEWMAEWYVNGTAPQLWEARQTTGSFAVVPGGSNETLTGTPSIPPKGPVEITWPVGQLPSGGRAASISPLDLMACAAISTAVLVGSSLF
ncbi:hypothetical protein BC832DRAFT_555793 [Gaertneriomyces semiglobifer]|nr:hypothetical protein BC832DRAFT_555793 [Gaertneriomyces semiglobifer]